jgi:hypothetical protein
MFFIIVIGTLQTVPVLCCRQLVRRAKANQRGEVVVTVCAAQRGQVVRPKVGVGGELRASPAEGLGAEVGDENVGGQP